MGEYARFNGQQVKIGTCEDMLYLRADQVHLVEPESSSLNPADEYAQSVIRFRFPFPDEDGIRPGEFSDPFRALGMYGVDELLKLATHDDTQFVSRRGYNVMLPCPEVDAGDWGGRFHRNGNPGPVRIRQQAYRDGLLVTILECGGCGALFRLPTLEHAEPLLVALRSKADAARRLEEHGLATWWATIADRIAAGYRVPAGV